MQHVTWVASTLDSLFMDISKFGLLKNVARTVDVLCDFINANPGILSKLRNLVSKHQWPVELPES